MNFIKSFFILTLSFLFIISCGGNSSYPTTSTSSDSSDDSTEDGSSTEVTDLDVSSYDSCQYYGLNTGSSASNCYEYQTSTDIALINLRSEAGTSTTIYSDSTFSSSGSSGFVGANNVLQIAEAQSLLSKLSKTTDGAGSNIAIVGSGINTLSTSSLNTGASYNYGYLNYDSTNNIENSSTVTVKDAEGGGKYLDDEATFNTFDTNDAAYSIYNKNSLEAFSPDQALDNSITFGDDIRPYSNVMTTSKYNVDSSGNVSLFLYDISTTELNNNHISDGLDSQFNALYVNEGNNSFDQTTFDYSSVGVTNTTSFCTASSTSTCTKDNNIFMNGVTSDTDSNTVLDSWFYQYSIFENAHNDVANGTALAAIIGTTGDTEIEGSASGATINSYKTQFYHRKLLTSTPEKVIFGVLSPPATTPRISPSRPSISSRPFPICGLAFSSLLTPKYRK